MEPPAYAEHLNSKESLITTYEAIRAGFVALALEKNRRATPFVAQARALKASASKAKRPRELLDIPEIRPALITATGLSDKAVNRIAETGKDEAIEGFIKTFLEPAEPNFVEELVFRFLLTSGDTLGSSMRNVGGFLAEKRFTRAVIARLRLIGLKCFWFSKELRDWNVLPDEDADIELSLRGLSWISDKGPRTMRYNLAIPFFENNVDISLFSCSYGDMTRETIENPLSYIALGELKGGIDPAGADEHWKTARTALLRIQTAFANYDLKPHTFFVGAAIEASMAEEIWVMLAEGTLENAANLTNDDQWASVAKWLCTL